MLISYFQNASVQAMASVRMACLGPATVSVNQIILAQPAILNCQCLRRAIRRVTGMQCVVLATVVNADQNTMATVIPVQVEST